MRSRNLLGNEWELTKKIHINHSPYSPDITRLHLLLLPQLDMADLGGMNTDKNFIYKRKDSPKRRTTQLKQPEIQVDTSCCLTDRGTELFYLYTIFGKSNCDNLRLQ